MDKKLPYHSDPAVNSQFKVLLVYSNSPMDNLMPVSVSALAGALRRQGFNTKLFDTTYYPVYELSGNEVVTVGGAERKGSLQVAEFSYKEVGIEFIGTDIYEDFRRCVKDYEPNLIALSTVEPTHLLGIKLLESVRDLGIPTIVGGCFAIFSTIL